MNDNIELFKKEIERVEKKYMNKKTMQENNFNSYIENPMKNSKISKDFIDNGVKELAEFVNKLLEKEDTSELKKELENILKTATNDIMIKIMYV